MRYLSLFSGIEAASCAWEPLGWTPVAFAEIEPFPCALLAHRWPHVQNLGDVTAITDERIAALGPIDVVIGGSPCQDLSVAGKRAGLRGERSSLFHEQVRIFDAARHLCGARWLVWENVPGAFTTHAGRDFARVVGDLAGCELPVPDDGWGTEGVALGVNGLCEWAVLDAQWFGVAQRRRRVFAILDVGNWRDRPPVLLEPESLRGNPPARGEKRERPSGTLTARSRSGGGLGADHALDGGLIVHALDAFSSGRATEDGTGRGVPLTAHSLRADGFDASEDGTGRGTPLVPEVAWALQERDAKGSDSSTKDGHLIPVAFNWQNGGGYGTANEGLGISTDHTPPQSRKQVAAVATSMQVRRLTPRECERLQGFPDDWTLIPVRGKPAADGPRYRALGNSMAVPVIAWIGRQIVSAQSGAHDT